MKIARLSVLSLAAIALLALGCNNSSSTIVSVGYSGSVTGPDGEAVVGATVYLVSAAAINTDPMTVADMFANTSTDRDEPLEDAVRNFGNTFAKAVTDAAGAFSLATIADGSYFIYAEPVGTEYLPGGSICRNSVNASGLRGNTTASIVMSSSPSITATFSGMSTCLTCHEKEAQKATAHRLGFTVPDTLSALQSDADHPELFDGNAYFLPVDTAGGGTFADGTAVYLSDPDFSRGFDDFKTDLSVPAGTLYVILWLWKDLATGAYNITIENIINGADPLSPATREVKLNYGGGVYKQRYMIEWPGRNGLYNLLQYQTAGDESKYDRTRKQFRDYHFDHYWDQANNLIQAPAASKNINVSCMGCHATGYTQYVDGAEVLCDSVEDVNGEYDIDGDGLLNDLNIGCETCHGPGSEHVAAATSGRYIVNPDHITSSREVMLCGRCHDRLVGNGPNAHNDIPMNAAGEFPPAGISRTEFLTSYVSQTGASPSALWADGMHAKSHHMQAPDFLQALHYRNQHRLMTCTNCHDLHGGTGFRSMLVEEPDDHTQPLCLTCRGAYMGTTAEHTAEVIGVAHGSAVARCIDCHMTKTAKTGAGDYGFLLAAPIGTSADPNNTYFENDITSHVMDVPRKTNVGVAGVLPGSAMPIPYTKACGTCHDPANLQY